MGHNHHHNHHHKHRRHDRKTPRSQTLPSSPTHSPSSSSDFEFTVSLSPRKSSPASADDLFYKGQLLPLHLSPRISMVRTLLLSSSSSSSDSHSSFSSGCDSSRPSSVADDDLHLQTKLAPTPVSTTNAINISSNQYHCKYLSPISRLSSVFREETKTPTTTTTTTTTTSIASGSSVKRMSVTRAKEMIRKYLKKARPLYEKLLSRRTAPKPIEVISHSFSGNLRFPKRRSCVSSCPSSMRSSPSHSGVLCRNSHVVRGAGGIYSCNSSSMEELQSAIQGAIAHCKSSMTQNNN